MDEAARDLARDWLTRASHDLQAARTLAATTEPLLDTAIYHCQQAAEKAVKGWLQSQDDPECVPEQGASALKLSCSVGLDVRAIRVGPTCCN